MESKKRLVIYFFYDKDGIADRYVDYFLQGLKPITDKFVIVSNGKITPNTRRIFLKYSQDIIVRVNKGLDAWAYKEAIEYIGWDKLREYYEVCLVNATIMGPVYPFEEMFKAMDKRIELDFWGINRYLKVEDDPFHCNPYGYLPEHIQSHFMVYRNKFLQARELKEYWDNLPPIHSYNESVGMHESHFTKHFQDMGFIWTTYVHNCDEEKYSPYYLMYAPKKAIIEDKCPIFKRKSFFLERQSYLTLNCGESAIELYKYLKHHTAYDTDMILENIIRTCNQYDFVNDLSLNYILSSAQVTMHDSDKITKVALIMHLYYMDLLDSSLHYAASMPDYADIYITTPDKNDVTNIREKFSKLPNHVQVRVIPNRGRDVSSLLCGVSDIINKYDFICFFHDKKVSQIKYLSIGRSFGYQISEAVLHNRIYVQNIINTFITHPRLGLLAPISPYHSVYADTLGGEWGPNFENTKRLAKELCLNVPMCVEKPPVAPLGTVFWFRTMAMKKLFAFNWNYTDFPEEPNQIDGTLLHAVERIYPYVVQDAGFYPAYVQPDFLASLNLMNMTFYNRELNEVLRTHGIYGSVFSKKILLNKMLSSYKVSILMLNYRILRKIKHILKRVLPAPMFRVVVKIKRKLW